DTFARGWHSCRCCGCFAPLSGRGHFTCCCDFTCPCDLLGCGDAVGSCHLVGPGDLVCCPSVSRWTFICVCLTCFCLFGFCLSCRGLRRCCCGGLCCGSSLRCCRLLLRQCRARDKIGRWLILSPLI